MVLIGSSLLPPHKKNLHQQENCVGLVHRKCLRGFARRGTAFHRDDLAVRCPDLGSLWRGTKFLRQTPAKPPLLSYWWAGFMPSFTTWYGVRSIGIFHERANKYYESPATGHNLYSLIARWYPSAGIIILLMHLKRLRGENIRNNLCHLNQFLVLHIPASQLHAARCSLNSIGLI